MCAALYHTPPSSGTTLYSSHSNFHVISNVATLGNVPTETKSGNLNSDFQALKLKKTIKDHGNIFS